MMEPVIQDLILPCVVVWFSFFLSSFSSFSSFFFAIAPEYEIASGFSGSELGG